MYSLSKCKGITEPYLLLLLRLWPGVGRFPAIRQRACWCRLALEFGQPQSLEFGLKGVDAEVEVEKHVGVRGEDDATFAP